MTGNNSSKANPTAERIRSGTNDFVNVAAPDAAQISFTNIKPAINAVTTHIRIPIPSIMVLWLTFNKPTFDRNTVDTKP